MYFHGDLAESWSTPDALTYVFHLRRNSGVASASNLNCGRLSLPRCSPTLPREIVRSPTSAGVGANTDPDFFEYAFSSKRFPPDGANRGHYRNARIDALTDQICVEMNQERRKALCSEVQKILADDLPYLAQWFNDVVSVHRRALSPLDLPSTGNYNFLTSLHPITAADSSHEFSNKNTFFPDNPFQRRFFAVSKDRCLFLRTPCCMKNTVMSRIARTILTD